MDKLGKLKKVENLRQVWHHEANDFSKWLAKDENLTLLSGTLELDLELIETEANVGSFSIDILAVDNNTNYNVVIENQLEVSNHDHLGKIITYASGKEANIIIWVVKTAREEHSKAINWLNDHTDPEISFFLIEIELWQIDNSDIAPKFNIICKPNNWAKTMKKSGLTSDVKKLQYTYWEKFNEIAEKSFSFLKEYNIVSPKPQHWNYLSVGTSQCKVAITFNTQKKKVGVELDIINNKSLFYTLEKSKDEINALFETKLIWFPLPNKKVSGISVDYYLDNLDSDNWENAINWQIRMCLIMKKIVTKYIL